MQDFVHLHVHTDYSLLDGASSIKTLIARTKEIGQKALAITDHGNMFGALTFYDACRKEDIKPIIGCEFYVAPGHRSEKSKTKYFHLVLLARNAEGWRNLIQLSSRSFIEGMYYKPRIDEELLRTYSKGLICLSACLQGELPVLLLEGKQQEAGHFIRKYRDIFGVDNFFIELQDHGIKAQQQVAPLLIEAARRYGVPLVVTNDSHYARKTDATAQDILLCIGTKSKRNDPTRMRFEGSEFYLKSAEQMAQLFPDYPETITNAVRIAERCNLEIVRPGPLLPEYTIPPEFESRDAYLSHLVFAGLSNRYKEITSDIRKRAEFELSVIMKMDFVGYFLIVWDFIDWAKRHGIPVGPGRGSGAGSIVAYALRITDIDPLQFNLLFERFLNPERISMPDFDVDFCYERRQEVIDYVREKYGDDRVGQIITFGTLKAKAAIKDVARVMEIPLSDVAMITKRIPSNPKLRLIDTFEINPDIQGSGQLASLKDDPRFAELFEIAFALEGANRNSSLHAAGIVIGKTTLTDYVPMYKDTKTGKLATQFTMDLIEKCGLVKMDFLGLKTLTLIAHTEQLVRKRGGVLAQFTIETISDTDPATYRMLGEGKSAAIFQFESQGMQNVLKRAKPDKIEDLIALNALYRPGPMENIDQFIASKFDPSKITYPDPCLKDILEETYGVIVYQEQVMQVAQRIAKYSLGQADLLRRAMSKKKEEYMIKEKVSFIDGAVKNGFSAEAADRIFEILVPFADYGFNKSHATAYSVLAYQTAYLKANFPAEFIAANLTNEISSTDKLPEYITEGRKMGLAIDPPDINSSDINFTVVDGRIVYGLLGIKGLGEHAARMIVAIRASNDPYKSFMDFLDRVDLHTVNKRVLEVLIQTGCFDRLGQNRSTLKHNLERAVDYATAKKNGSKFGQISLFESSGEQEFSEFVFEHLEEWPQKELLRIEKGLIGFYISGHPMDNYRKAFERGCTFDIRYADKAQSERLYTVVGMIQSVKPYQTKAGKWMAFGVFEDFNGTIELTFFPNIWDKARAVLLPDTVWGLIGKIDNTREKPNLLVEEWINPDVLQEQSLREIHIAIDATMSSEESLHPLRDFLFDSRGNCSVFFHVDGSEGYSWTIKATNQLQVSGAKETVQDLMSLPGVTDVWRE